MKFLLLVICWCILFALSWPLAVLAVLLFPIIWIIALPFRLAGAVLDGLIGFIRAVCLFPARILGLRKEEKA